MNSFDYLKPLYLMGNIGTCLRRTALHVILLSITILVFCSCSTEGVIGGAVASTVVGGQSPAHEIQQVYYLGVFDPQEQVPPTIYRLTVRGQASFISNKKFASGWVPAQVIDSLNSHVGIDANGETGNPLTITPGQEHLSTFETGRRLVMFGPEGFREAPRNHRLVIVMGASPKNFFKGIDMSLGSISQVRYERSNSELQRQIFEEFVRIKEQEITLQELRNDLAIELPR
jgi:hypothetical protein